MARDLTSTIGRHFAERGYCVVDRAFDSRDVELMCQEAVDVCLGNRGFISRNPGADCRTVEDVNDRVIAVHFPHKVSEVFRAYLAHRSLTRVLAEIVGPNVKCMQSMIFMKSRGLPGQAWHQDEAFIPTADRSLVGAWIALDRATIENGCLWVIPGSHRHGTLWEMRRHDDPRFDGTPETFGFPYEEETAEPVEVERGSVVFFHGYVLHRSLPNTAPAGYRRALVNHYMSAESPLKWSGGIPENMRDDYRDIVMVAGTDPRAALGVEDLSLPYYRTRDLAA
ncbi:MAG: phytanoyl-CoA dioxygenase family protein [Gammaproteobacteria bacterium]|nr:phytanoyl-CoA dioxygenase family protein [Gammaproteobacteria bacterium]